MKRFLSWSAGAAIALVAIQPARADINEEAKLTDVGFTAGALAGSASAISGTTAVLGAPAENGGAGGAYVFVKSGGTWSLQQHITASDAAAGDAFGAAVAVHGDEIAVGAPGKSTGHGRVYVFNRSGTVWTEDPSVITGAGATAGDAFGHSVSIEGTTLAVGAPFEAVGSKLAEGLTYAYVFDGSAWVLQRRIAETRGNARAGDHIGWAVSLSGNTIFSGAPDDQFGNKVARGSIYVYVRNGTVWSRQTRLNPGGAANDRAGSAVSISGNNAVVGADGHKVGANANAGQAFAYTRTGTSWSLNNTLTASNAAANDHFGAAVSISGPYAVIGAPHDLPSPGSGNGQAYLFGLTGANLTELLKLVDSDNAAGDTFGASTGFDSGRAVVGSPYDDAVGTDSGAGYVFGVVTPTITAITSDLPDPSNAGSPYTVSVLVTCDPASLACTPTGTVDINDGDGANCQIAALAPDVPNVGASGSCQITSIAPGPHTLTANYNGTLVFGASSDQESHDVSGDDVGVTKSDGVDVVAVGQVVNYTIVVSASASGLNPANGVAVNDTVPAELTNVTWTCVDDGQAGDSCTNASGNGSISGELVNVIPGGHVTFTVTGTVSAALTSAGISNTVTIVPPTTGFTDLNSNNDTATDLDDSDILFSDSFEGP